MELIDIEMFINEVRKRPALWDCSSEVYKNRLMKENSWKEISEVLFADSLMDEQKRGQMGKELRMKWRHIRDAYIRNLRSKHNMLKLGVPGKSLKPYVYARQMSFLKTMFNFDPDVSSFNYMPNIPSVSIQLAEASGNSMESSMQLIQDDVSQETFTMTTQVDDDKRNCNFAPAHSTEEVKSLVSRPTRRKNKRRKFNVDEQLEEFLNKIDSGGTNSSVENEDSAFFRSLLPHVQTLSAIDKLKFRKDVMDILISYCESDQKSNC